MRRLWQVLLQLAEGGRGESLSCEDCFMLLDCLSDMLAEGYAAEEVMPIADKYLGRCPGCRQEYMAELAELLDDRQQQPALLDQVLTRPGSGPGSRAGGRGRDG